MICAADCFNGIENILQANLSQMTGLLEKPNFKWFKKD